MDGRIREKSRVDKIRNSHFTFMDELGTCGGESEQSRKEKSTN
jgi:hypothetical protein